MNWPKYYTDQILKPNPEGRLAIVSGWSKKEEIEKNLTDENLNKVGAIGQLYSKEGVNYIIKNLFLNPKINTLIISGKDLSGSLEFLKNLIKNGESEKIIHKEIPQEKIEQFLAWFSQHTYFTDEDKINDIISGLDIKDQDWIDITEEFPEPEQSESIDFPSEEVCIRLEDKKISDLWLKVLDRILKFGVNKMSQYSEMQREIVNLTTIISDEDPDDPFLPDFLYFNEKDLKEYYPQLMTDNVFEGVEYTYGSRLRNFQGIDQIKAIIDDLKANSYSRRAIAFTWDVLTDTGNPKSPCLNIINALVQRDRLYITAYMRSNDMYRAWPQNAFAFRKIQKEIAEAINMPMGKLIIVSNSAHIYERDFLIASETVEKHKPALECTQDPRGSFEINVADKKIKLNHYSPQGLKIQEFEGENSQEIQNKIFTFISDPLHALDLGGELMKAEIALNNNLEYKQDNMLEFNLLANHNKQGKFIVIDGTDGSGKGTQTALLVKRLQNNGYEVEMADFPQYGEKSAGLVEEYLNGNYGSALEVGPYRASIFFACDRFAAAPKIKKWINEGKIVIANRYVSSNMGHQSGKIKDAKNREKFLNWLEELEYDIFEIPRPDLNILLYMPPEIGQELVDKKESRDYIKGKKRDIHEADIQHLKDAAQAYLDLAKNYGWTTIDCAPEGNLNSIEHISDQLWQKIKDKI